MTETEKIQKLAQDFFRADGALTEEEIGRIVCYEDNDGMYHMELFHEPDQDVREYFILRIEGVLRAAGLPSVSGQRCERMEEAN
jgi:hypothetical protein